MIIYDIWLGREDSNLRMPASKAGALGHLATPHNIPQMAIKPTSLTNGAQSTKLPLKTQEQRRL